MVVYLGCYTDAEHPDGLKMLELDEATGAMRVAAEYPVSNAIYQALSPDGRILYSCTGEGIASFEVAEDARLVPIDRKDISSCVCHLSVMPDCRHVVWADYANGTAGSVEIAEGRFGKTVTHRHSGSGPNLPRQDKAHCHQAVPAPGGEGYCVVDLGLDRILEYPAGRVYGTKPEGAGPRHLIFHPNGRLAFLVYELGNFVSSLSWSPADGFRILDTLPVLTDSNNFRIPFFNDTATQPSAYLAAAIRFTPDMRGIVVSNRGENSLAVFDFDAGSGRLSFKARTMLEGSWPRDFIFVSERMALAAMERSGAVLSLRYDARSGKFTILSALDGLHRPVALLGLVGK